MGPSGEDFSQRDVKPLSSKSTVSAVPVAPSSLSPAQQKQFVQITDLSSQRRQTSYAGYQFNFSPSDQAFRDWLYDGIVASGKAYRDEFGNVEISYQDFSEMLMGSEFNGAHLSDKQLSFLLVGLFQGKTIRFNSERQIVSPLNPQALRENPQAYKKAAEFFHLIKHDSVTGKSGWGRSLWEEHVLGMGMRQGLEEWVRSFKNREAFEDTCRAIELSFQAAGKSGLEELIESETESSLKGRLLGMVRSLRLGGDEYYLAKAHSVRTGRDGGIGDLYVSLKAYQQAERRGEIIPQQMSPEETRKAIAELSEKAQQIKTRALEKMTNEAAIQELGLSREQLQNTGPLVLAALSASMNAETAYQSYFEQEHQMERFRSEINATDLFRGAKAERDYVGRAYQAFRDARDALTEKIRQGKPLTLEDLDRVSSKMANLHREIDVDWSGSEEEREAYAARFKASQEAFLIAATSIVTMGAAGLSSAVIAKALMGTSLLKGALAAEQAATLLGGVAGTGVGFAAGTTFETGVRVGSDYLATGEGPSVKKGVQHAQLAMRNAGQAAISFGAGQLMGTVKGLGMMVKAEQLRERAQWVDQVAYSIGKVGTTTGFARGGYYGELWRRAVLNNVIGVANAGIYQNWEYGLDDLMLNSAFGVLGGVAEQRLENFKVISRAWEFVQEGGENIVEEWVEGRSSTEGFLQALGGAFSELGGAGQANQKEVLTKLEQEIHVREEQKGAPLSTPEKVAVLASLVVPEGEKSSEESPHPPVPVRIHRYDPEEAESKIRAIRKDPRLSLQIDLNGVMTVFMAHPERAQEQIPIMRLEPSAPLSSEESTPERLPAKQPEHSSELPAQDRTVEVGPEDILEEKPARPFEALLEETQAELAKNKQATPSASTSFIEQALEDLENTTRREGRRKAFQDSQEEARALLTTADILRAHRTRLSVARGSHAPPEQLHEIEKEAEQALQAVREGKTPKSEATSVPEEMPSVPEPSKIRTEPSAQVMARKVETPMARPEERTETEDTVVISSPLKPHQETGKTVPNWTEQRLDELDEVLDREFGESPVLPPLRSPEVAERTVRTSLVRNEDLVLQEGEGEPLSVRFNAAGRASVQLANGLTLHLRRESDGSYRCSYSATGENASAQLSRDWEVRPWPEKLNPGEEWKLSEGERLTFESSGSRRQLRFITPEAHLFATTDQLQSQVWTLLDRIIYLTRTIAFGQSVVSGIEDLHIQARILGSHLHALEEEIIRFRRQKTKSLSERERLFDSLEALSEEAQALESRFKSIEQNNFVALVEGARENLSTLIGQVADAELTRRYQEFEAKFNREKEALDVAAQSKAYSELYRAVLRRIAEQEWKKRGKEGSPPPEFLNWAVLKWVDHLMAVGLLHEGISLPVAQELIAEVVSFYCDYPPSENHLMHFTHDLSLTQNFLLGSHPTANSYLRSVISNLKGYRRLFGADAGLLFQEGRALSCEMTRPDPHHPGQRIGTGYFLVARRGRHEYKNGLELAIFDTENAWKDLDESTPALAKIGIHFAENGALQIVNIQGAPSKKVGEKNNALAQALGEASPLDMLLTTAIVWGREKGFDRVEGIRDSAQQARKNNPGETPGFFYDRFFKRFRFEAPRADSDYHTLDLNTLPTQRAKRSEDDHTAGQYVRRILLGGGKESEQQARYPRLRAFWRTLVPAFSALTWEEAEGARPQNLHPFQLTSLAHFREVEDENIISVDSAVLPPLRSPEVAERTVRTSPVFQDFFNEAAQAKAEKDQARRENTEVNVLPPLFEREMAKNTVEEIAAAPKVEEATLEVEARDILSSAELIPPREVTQPLGKRGVAGTRMSVDQMIDFCRDFSEHELKILGDWYEEASVRGEFAQSVIGAVGLKLDPTRGKIEWGTSLKMLLDRVQNETDPAQRQKAVESLEKWVATLREARERLEEFRPQEEAPSQKELESAEEPHLPDTSRGEPLTADAAQALAKKFGFTDPKFLRQVDENMSPEVGEERAELAFKLIDEALRRSDPATYLKDRQDIFLQIVSGGLTLRETLELAEEIERENLQKIGEGQPVVVPTKPLVKAERATKPDRPTYELEPPSKFNTAVSEEARFPEPGIDTDPLPRPASSLFRGVLDALGLNEAHSPEDPTESGEGGGEKKITNEKSLARTEPGKLARAGEAVRGFFASLALVVRERFSDTHREWIVAHVLPIIDPLISFNKMQLAVVEKVRSLPEHERARFLDELLDIAMDTERDPYSRSQARHALAASFHLLSEGAQHRLVDAIFARRVARRYEQRAEAWVTLGSIVDQLPPSVKLSSILSGAIECVQMNEGPPVFKLAAIETLGKTLAAATQAKYASQISNHDLEVGVHALIALLPRRDLSDSMKVVLIEALAPLLQTERIPRHYRKTIVTEIVIRIEHPNVEIRGAAISSLRIVPLQEHPFVVDEMVKYLMTYHRLAEAEAIRTIERGLGVGEQRREGEGIDPELRGAPIKKLADLLGEEALQEVLRRHPIRSRLFSRTIAEARNPNPTTEAEILVWQVLQIEGGLAEAVEVSRRLTAEALAKNKSGRLSLAESPPDEGALSLHEDAEGGVSVVETSEPSDVDPNGNSSGPTSLMSDFDFGPTLETEAHDPLSAPRSSLFRGVMGWLAHDQAHSDPARTGGGVKGVLALASQWRAAQSQEAPSKILILSSKEGKSKWGKLISNAALELNLGRTLTLSGARKDRRLMAENRAPQADCVLFHPENLEHISEKEKEGIVAHAGLIVVEGDFSKGDIESHPLPKALQALSDVELWYVDSTSGEIVEKRKVGPSESNPPKGSSPVLGLVAAMGAGLATLFSFEGASDAAVRISDGVLQVLPQVTEAAAPHWDGLSASSDSNPQGGTPGSHLGAAIGALLIGASLLSPTVSQAADLATEQILPRAQESGWFGVVFGVLGLSMMGAVLGAKTLFARILGNAAVSVSNQEVVGREAVESAEKDEKQVRELADTLSSARNHTSSTAKIQAIRELALLLNSSITAISKYGIIRRLTERIRDPNPQVAEAALQSLEGLPLEGFSFVVHEIVESALTSESPEVRARAVTIINHIAQKSGRAFLERGGLAEKMVEVLGEEVMKRLLRSESSAGPKAQSEKNDLIWQLILSGKLGEAVEASRESK